MTSGLPFSLEVNHACKYKKKRGNPRHHMLFYRWMDAKRQAFMAVTCKNMRSTACHKCRYWRLLIYHYRLLAQPLNDTRSDT